MVVEGQQLLLRRGDGLSEPSGQLLLNFDATSDQGTAVFPIPAIPLDRENISAGNGYGIEQLRDLAGELEAEGNLTGALDFYRSIVVAGSAAAEDHFALGNLLYQTGDLSAARERFYVAIELDDDYVEARLNLGCVLVELHEPDLAEAAYRGALDCHPDYADVHYHLARLLDQLGRCDEALIHWTHFCDLTPESPWAEEAQDRLSTVE
jgi:tetratricopeptide (TPR) repeat protein